MRTQIVLLALSLLSINAFADGMVRTDFGYVMDDQSSGGTDTKPTRQPIEFAGGYLWPSGFTILGQYVMEADPPTASPRSSVPGNRHSFGPGIEWISRKD